MFDAHCHLDRAPRGAAAMPRARDAGLTGMVLAGVAPDGWSTMVGFGRDHGAHVCLGVHPWAVSERWRGDVDRLAEALARLSPVGLGETGLDHGRRVDPASHPHQEAAFRAQLRLARDRDLPVVLHVVSAHDLAISIVAEESPGDGMVHGFSGTVAHARRWLDLGLHISLGGPITWARARKAKAVARFVPDDRLLVETDAPDQVAEPFRSRGDPGEPAHLRVVIEALAALRGQDTAELERRTEDNARRLFRIP